MIQKKQKCHLALEELGLQKAKFFGVQVNPSALKALINVGAAACGMAKAPAPTNDAGCTLSICRYLCQTELNEKKGMPSAETEEHSPYYYRPQSKRYGL